MTSFPKGLEKFSAADFENAGLSLKPLKLDVSPSATAIITAGVAATTVQVNSTDGHGGSGYLTSASGSSGSSQGTLYYSSWSTLINTAYVYAYVSNGWLSLYFYDTYYNFTGSFGGSFSGGAGINYTNGYFKFYV